MEAIGVTPTNQQIAGQKFKLRKLNEADFGGVQSYTHQRVLEPGDLVFIRWEMDWWNIVSKLVVSVDTFFSHVAIYVGDGQLVDSSLGGVNHFSLDALNELTKENSCVVVGRPNRSPKERLAAAVWAGQQARKPSDADVVAFDLGALATSYVVLAKQRMRNSVATAIRGGEAGHVDYEKSISVTREALEKAIERMRDEQEEFDDPFEGPIAIPAVCGGFVWQAYAQLGRPPLVPAFLEGTRFKGEGRFGPPSMDPSVLEVILGENHLDTFGFSDILKKAGPLVSLLKEGRVVMPALLKAVRGKEATSIAEMLSPADLCFSDDMKELFFLAEGHEEVAEAWQTAQAQKRTGS